jgi:hypothetical protein
MRAKICKWVTFHKLKEKVTQDLHAIGRRFSLSHGWGTETLRYRKLRTANRQEDSRLEANKDAGIVPSLGSFDECLSRSVSMN